MLVQKKWQVVYKRDLNDPDNHDNVITHLEPGILECEVKWSLGSSITNKASGGDGIPVELFQILKHDAVKVLHSICQQIWETWQWPQDWKRSVFIPIPEKGNELPELAQTHVHRIGDAIESSHPLSSPSPPAFNLSQHQGLFR